MIYITLYDSNHLEFSIKLRNDLLCIGYRYIFIVPDCSVEVLMTELVSHLSDIGVLFGANRHTKRGYPTSPHTSTHSSAHSATHTHLDGTTADDNLSGFHILQVLINPNINTVLTLFPHYIVVVVPSVDVGVGVRVGDRGWDKITRVLLENAIGIWYEDQPHDSNSGSGSHGNRGGGSNRAGSGSMYDEIYTDIVLNWENNRPTSYNIQLSGLQSSLGPGPGLQSGLGAGFGMPLSMLEVSLRSIVLNLVSELFCYPFEESVGDVIQVRRRDGECGYGCVCVWIWGIAWARE